MNIQIINAQQTPSVGFMENPEEFGKANRELIEKVIDSVKFMGSAIGLAANQVSVDGERCQSRFFIELDKNTKNWNVIINPQIISSIGMIDYTTEGCLTWPGQCIIGKRFRQIKVSYYTIDGDLKEEIITKFRAHVWQHEINHLDGINEIVKTYKEVYDASAVLASYQRNEKCPCGSGNKYKVCCLPFEPTNIKIYKSIKFD